MISNPAVVHESYAFVCMSCGRGWERDYEINHAIDTHGDRLCVYYSEGLRVESPFTRPACEHCGGNRLRILRAGRVASAAGSGAAVSGGATRAKIAKPAKAAKVPAQRGASRRLLHMLHLSA